MPDTFFSSTLLVKTNKLSVSVTLDSLVLGTSVALVLKSHCFFSLENLSVCLKHSVGNLLTLFSDMLIVNI